MAVAELLSNGVVKQLVERRRPPKEWIPHDDVEDRPESSSFPSGHTAAAVAFTASVGSSWPWAGAACAVPAVLLALERVHSGVHYPSDVAAGACIGLAATAWSGQRPASFCAGWTDPAGWRVTAGSRGKRAVQQRAHFKEEKIRQGGSSRGPGHRSAKGYHSARKYYESYRSCRESVDSVKRNAEAPIPGTTGTNWGC
ncbi:phosphatase PAP2 family protein [Streptomyces sp. NPDC002886]|uniref:phosphatase PAP2 family protein n=1 Tax=Streptomyces sp. NPDC002886 TaxID=3364667 RepID=UPI00367B71EC